MARWLIRIVNQPPVQVDAPDDRNLAAEFEVACDAPQSVWAWLLRRPRYWKVSEKVTLHCAAVVGIEPLRSARRTLSKAPIGFSTT